MDIRIRIDDREVLAAFAASPGVMSASIDRFLSRAASEVARSARDAAPKAFSNLANSIRFFRISPLHWRVAPGVNYSGYVEDGTRPHQPPVEAIRPWVERVLGLRDDAARTAAFLIARKIAGHGTRAQPYMAVAAGKMESRVIRLVREGVDAGLREVFGR